MEPPDDGMHLLDAGGGLRLPDRIDDPAVAARSENDETVALDQEVSPDLVLEIIGNECAGILRRWHLVREATEAVHDADLFPGRLKRLLRAYERDLSGSEGMIGDDGRPLGHHQRKVRVHDCLAVECAELPQNILAGAEAIFTADEER